MRLTESHSSLPFYFFLIGIASESKCKREQHSFHLAVTVGKDRIKPSEKFASSSSKNTMISYVSVSDFQQLTQSPF